MDSHLHDRRTGTILCKDLCALFTSNKSKFFLGGSGYLKSQTEHPGLLTMKGLLYDYTTTHDKNSLTNVQ